MASASEGTVVLRTDKVSQTKSDDGPAVVIQLHPPGTNLGRRFELGDGEHVVGRQADTEIPIEADSVSRRHARFARGASGWFVEDLGSTNGCFVNDQRVTLHPLKSGDLVRCGEAILKFLAGSNIEAAYHEEIYRMSIVDGLTGVYNKRYFLEYLDRELSRSIRHGLPLALVLFDIDFFKKVNDTYGHLAGDEVLKEIGRRLRPRIRKEDLLARYGGEEFACILPSTTRQGGVAFAESIRVIVEREPFCTEGGLLPITVSLGSFAREGDVKCDVSDMIRRADENLYAAKHAGRNRVVG